jgi:hypothetical protein
LWVKGLNANVLIKKGFLFTVGSVYCVKRFTTGPRNYLKEVQQSQMIQKWLRRQPKDLHSVGFDALVKQWDKCISVGGGYFEK